jgi:hypothetical protein
MAALSLVTETATEASDRRIATLKEGAKAAEELARAERELALARIAAQEGAGGITADQAAAKRTAIEEAFARTQVDRENKTAREIVGIRKAELEELTNTLPRLEAELDLKRAAARKLKAPAAVEADIAKTKENLAAQQKTIGETQKEIESKEKLPQLFGLRSLMVKQLEEKKEGEIGTRDSLQRLLKAQEFQLPGVQTAAETAAEGVTAGEKKVRETRARIGALQRDVPVLEASTERDVTVRERVADVQRQTRAISGPPTDANVARRAEAINAEAIRQPGIQAGETMAGATMMAVKEFAIPGITEGYLNAIEQKAKELRREMDTKIGTNRY